MPRPSGSGETRGVASQLERVEHLDADVSDLLLILGVCGHLLQHAADGLEHLLAALEVCAAAVQNP